MFWSPPPTYSGNIRRPISTDVATLGLGDARQTRTMRCDAFDMFGFVTLSIAVGALQLMLDRGELKDWFRSTEIWIG